jgi:hypothetical protein
MYIDVNWETVNSINGIYTAMIIPNTDTPLFFKVYLRVL